MINRTFKQFQLIHMQHCIIISLYNLHSRASSQKLYLYWTEKSIATTEIKVRHLLCRTNQGSILATPKGPTNWPGTTLKHEPGEQLGLAQKQSFTYKAKRVLFLKSNIN